MNDVLINVGVAQVKTPLKKPTVLRTILGSCIGICIYDRMKKVAVCPYSAPKDTARGATPEKFADTAIPCCPASAEGWGQKEIISPPRSRAERPCSSSVQRDPGTDRRQKYRRNKKSTGNNWVFRSWKSCGGNTGRVIVFTIPTASEGKGGRKEKIVLQDLRLSPGDLYAQTYKT
jgi:hypothetical protein